MCVHVRAPHKRCCALTVRRRAALPDAALLSSPPIRRLSPPAHRFVANLVLGVLRNFTFGDDTKGDSKKRGGDSDDDAW